MDNLSALATLIGQQIDPLGADGSILAVNHRDRLIEVMTKAGKYTGNFFQAELSRTSYPSGTLSWNNASMNQATFEMIVSENTSDLNDFGDIVENVGGITLIRFKDFAGRSSLYFLRNMVSEQLNGEKVYRLTLESFDTNPTYTYQPTEKMICSLDVIPNINTKMLFGDLQVFKIATNTNPFSIETGDTVVGQLNNDVFLSRGVYVAGDPLELTSYDDNSDFYDPNENV